MTKNIKPWELDETPWRTEAAYCSYLRGGLRKALWNRSPIKLSFLRSKRYKLPLGRCTKKNPKGMVFVLDCEECKETLRQAELEVDHRGVVNSLKTLEDLKTFIEGLVLVSFEDLRILCKACHKIHSYADRLGISFEEAALRKRIISLRKWGVRAELKFLRWKGFTEDQISNKIKRTKCFEEVIKNGTT